MVDLTTLSAGPARLDIAASLGGGLARLNVNDLPVLRPWQLDANTPFSLASIVLVPFSNRISNGGFDWNDKVYPLEPNLPGEAFPIHGDGFQKSWSLEQHGQTANLALTDGAIGPWRYQAQQKITLTDEALTIGLDVTNTGADPMPFGAGFHPWFPRGPETRLSFDARTVWMEDAHNLPTDELALRDATEWSFASARPLPDGWINNGYTGWTGAARIEQGADAVSCCVTASSNLDTAIVFSPDSRSDFFCFEPVSHPVNAFHLSGHPGLKVLRRGETMTAQMTISWSCT